MRILFLSRWFPFPPSNGAKLRIYQLLHGLSRQHEVTLLTFQDQPEAAPDLEGLRSVCREVLTIPLQPFDQNSRNGLFDFLNPTPRAYAAMFSPLMKAQIDEVLARTRFDLVIASEIDMAAYSPHFQGLPALLEELEVGVLHERFSQASRLAVRLRYGLTWIKHQRYVRRLLKNFKACTVVSEQERRLVSTMAPGFDRIEVVPNCLDWDEYATIPRLPQANTLIFTGSFNYFPNYDAMCWFVGEILPRVQAEVPDVRLVITGDHGGRTLPAASNVTLTGYLPDIRPLVASSWISLAPIRHGGGTRLKILEAMALGTPVVATSKGAEGLEVRAGREVLLADSPESFSAGVVRLLREPGIRQQMAEQACERGRTRYDWAAVLPRFLDLVEKVGMEK